VTGCVTRLRHASYASRLGCIFHAHMWHDPFICDMLYRQTDSFVLWDDSLTCPHDSNVHLHRRCYGNRPKTRMCYAEQGAVQRRPVRGTRSRGVRRPRRSLCVCMCVCQRVTSATRSSACVDMELMVCDFKRMRTGLYSGFFSRNGITLL